MQEPVKGTDKHGEGWQLCGHSGPRANPSISSCCSSLAGSGPGSKQEMPALGSLDTRSWVHILPMPLPGCMTLGKVLLLSESPLPFLQIGN